MSKRSLVIVFGGLMALGLWGCSGDEKPSSTDPSKFSSIYTNILRFHNCHSCHSPGGSAYDTDGVQLDFSTQALAHSTLTTKNVTGATSVGTCGSVKIVNTTPQTSFLAGVLFSTYHISNFAGVSGCTPYSVHLSDQNLSSSEETAIVDWINAGAQNN
ncbi:MAG: hypothetical protein H6624_18910 [Bdellovibrionaceae bacterium]|nr:hypothetical protein [Bdellovibrionales bacterium]MCB9086418.1 hypothetical protein [Pseudobdellovibrionaceae bacterium]